MRTLSIIIHAVQVMTVAACFYYLLKRRSAQPYRFFSLGWILILLQDLTMVVIGLFYPVHNQWVYNIALPLQQLFCMFFFMLLLQQKKWMIAMVIFTLFVLFNLFQWQGLVKLNTVSLALGGIIIVVLAFSE